VVQVAVLEIITPALKHLVAEHKQTAAVELDTEIQEGRVSVTQMVAVMELMVYLMKEQVVAVLDQPAAMEHLIEQAEVVMEKHSISPVKWYIMQVVVAAAITGFNLLQML
jgi:hypothetical protein